MKPARLWCAAPTVHRQLCNTGKRSLAYIALPAVAHCEASQALVCCTHIAHLLGLLATIVYLLRLPRRVHAGAATLRACWGCHTACVLRNMPYCVHAGFATLRACKGCHALCKLGLPQTACLLVDMLLGTMPPAAGTISICTSC